jgi:hypothetical protein
MARDEMHCENLDLDIIVLLEAISSHFLELSSEPHWDHNAFNQGELSAMSRTLYAIRPAISRSLNEKDFTTLAVGRRLDRR